MNNQVNLIPLKRETLYQGPGIPPPSNLDLDSIVTKFTQAILHGGHFTLDFIQKNVIKAIFFKQDPGLLKLFQNQLQNELDHLATIPPKTELESIVWNAFLGHILGILPYSYPIDNQLIKIPYLHHNKCELVEYKIEVLLLNDPEAPSPLIALGLTPTINKTARPILSYLGTTYPTGSGFLASILTDFYPNNSVGENTYKCSKPVIDQWLQDKKNVHVVGTSLGGALAFHTLKDNYENLARIDVYNPPGLYSDSWKNEFNKGCSINIYQQPMDMVPMMGCWPEGKKVNLYHISNTKALPASNSITAHLRAYSGCPEIAITQQDPAEENDKIQRKFLTFIHQHLGPFLVYYPCKLLYTIYKLCVYIQNRFDSFLRMKI